MSVAGTNVPHAPPLVVTGVVERLFGTYVDRAGIGSKNRRLTAGSCPVLVNRTVYSSSSPRSVAPPFTSTTDFTGRMSGAKMSVVKKTPAG